MKRRLQGPVMGQKSPDIQEAPVDGSGYLRGKTGKLRENTLLVLKYAAQRLRESPGRVQHFKKLLGGNNIADSLFFCDKIIQIGFIQKNPPFSKIGAGGNQIGAKLRHKRGINADASTAYKKEFRMRRRPPGQYHLTLNKHPALHSGCKTPPFRRREKSKRNGFLK